MMKQTAVVVAPGRGIYNTPELGYLAKHHADQSDLIGKFDTLRQKQNQPTLKELDSATRFSTKTHTRGDNASALIHACAYLDFLSIDREKFDIVAVTGNSMGWYIALTCAGVLGPIDGMQTVNTMGTLMQQALIGGQMVYPFVDENWQEVPGQRAKIFDMISEINTRPDHVLSLSIDLGGMVVIAGNDAGLEAFMDEMPRIQERYPLRLPNHAAFHSMLQAPVAEQGRRLLPTGMYSQPKLPLVDGRGGLWFPKASNLKHLWDYTLNHQVVKTYDFTTAIRTAAREFMPDVFIVLGPGTTLGGAVAQSLIRANWRGWNNKSDFQSAQSETPRLIAMGRPDQRDLVVGG